MSRFAFGPPKKGLVAALGVAIGVGALAGAQRPAVGPGDAEKTTAQIVVALLEYGHLSHPQVDDAISRKWARLFLKQLDPQKLYFEKADVAEFLADDATLDDQIKKGDIAFARRVFDRYLERRAQRLETVLELLQEKPDFTVDETIVDDPDLVEYPADAAEARERWREQLKYELLLKKVSDVDEAEAVKQLSIRHKDNARAFRQFDQADLLEVYLTALTMAVDPNSTYMGPKTVEDFNQGLQLSLEGIGASLSVEDGLPVIKEIVAGGAADKDGRLQTEDKILAVEREDGTLVDFAEKKLPDVVRVIRGKRGTKVKLVVQPAGSKDRKTYELTREKIELADQRARGQVIEATGADGKAIKVGVIELPSFYGDGAAVRRGEANAVSATADCRRFLEEFKQKGVDSVLIDLRHNGGGLLTEGISLSGLFIDTGPVVQVRDAEEVMHHDDEEAGVAWDGPLVVLTSRMSASASEIFAGVIKDYGRGLLVGDATTHGKGTVQTLIPLNDKLRRPEGIPDLGSLKLTVQQFYRANGESTQIKGVPPDLHLPSSRDHLDFLGEGERENALAFDKIEGLPHDQYNRVPADLLARLEQRSRERREASDDFRKLDESIQKMIARKDRHEIALNEAKFRAEFVADDEDDPEAIERKAGEAKAKEQEKAKTGARGARPSQRSAWDGDSFYNREVLAIVADYATLGSDLANAAPVHPEAAARP